MTCLRPTLCILTLLALLGPGAGVASANHHDWDAQQDPAYVEPTDPAPAPLPAVPFNPSEYPDPYDPGVPDIPAPVPVPVPLPRPQLPVVPVPTTQTIPGTRALVRADGLAAIPRGAPQRVRQVIAAANKIIGKPYKWGGGHARLADAGYDCSGAVGYSLIRSGFLQTTVVSGQLAHWGVAGSGSWISVYANRNHVYMEVAGLRFDTSAIGDPSGRSGVRWRGVIGRRGGFHARHPLGL
jgi:hypothetical protein